MTVYVDDMQAQFGRMIMSHMMADSTDELLAMADTLGVARKWIQYPGTWKEHFDISKGKRALALRHGAQAITFADLGRMSKSRRDKAVAWKVRKAVLISRITVTHMRNGEGTWCGVPGSVAVSSMDMVSCVPCLGKTADAKYPRRPRLKVRVT